MNFYDSEKMSDLLMNHGYATTDTQEDADLIIILLDPKSLDFKGFFSI